jgi:hypothetical protein
MSSGPFLNSFYTPTYAPTAIHPIRVQPETIAAVIGAVGNTPPTGPATNPIQARVSGGRRSIGLLARLIRVRLPITGQPAGYQPGSILTFPVLNLEAFAAATKGAEVAYLGVTCTCIGRSAERVDGSAVG